MKYGAIYNIDSQDDEQREHFEYEPLFISHCTNLDEREKSPFWHTNASLIFPYLSIVTLFCFIIFLGNYYPISHLVLKKIDVEVTVHRFGYSPIASIKGMQSPAYVTLKKYIGVIEPYSPMVVELTGQNDENSYIYSVLTKRVSETVVATGPISQLSSISSSFRSDNITIPCHPYDEFSLKVSTLSQNGVIITETNFPLICMYVRREIRSLHSDDLAKVLDSMLLMYNSDEEEGRVKYGNNFHSSTYFNEWHYFNAAQRDADHIHEGTGFLLQHIKSTNLFELAMQSIDPSVTLPYWDYTIEGQAGVAVYNSPIFTPDMFGSCPMPKDMDIGFSYSYDSLLDAAIPNGRWAYLKADFNTKYLNMVQPYGYLRSPWNLNPSPYVSRYTFTDNSVNLPTCTNFLDQLNLTDFNKFHTSSSIRPHGSVHTLTGGLMGCELLSPLFELGYIRNIHNSMSLCGGWGFIIKKLYRHYKFTIPIECKAKSYTFTDIEHCSFQCEDREAIGKYTKLVLELDDYVFSDPYEGNISASSYLGEFICGGNASKIYTGDHLESASTADPSFWVIHPTLDRLLQAKNLAGGFETATWPTEASETCSLYQCHSNATDIYEDSYDCCYGHHLTDRVLDYELGNRYSYIGATNKEVMESTDPRYSTYSVPYIYDSFVWDHCEQAGISISGLISELKSKYGVI